MGQSCELFVIDVRTVDQSLAEKTPIFRLPVLQSKITSMLWGTLDETIITGHNDGQINLWDIRVCFIKLIFFDRLLIVIFFFFRWAKN